MTSEEVETWRRLNPIAITDRDFAAAPCSDCPAWYAREMRSLGRCNGTPGLVG